MAIPNIESIIRAHSDFSMDDPAEQYIEATKMHRLTFGIDMPDTHSLHDKPELDKSHMESDEADGWARDSA